LSEETDAIVIVVSEETGTIAYADGGKLHRKIDLNTLRGDLLKSFGMVAEEKAAAPAAA
jgi:diadenylate cyclase